MSARFETVARGLSRARVLRLGVGLLALLALVAVVLTNRLLVERFTETTRNRAEVRLTLYSGNLTSELLRNSVVPQLLARDPALIGALDSSDYTQSTQRLLSFVDEIGAASLMLLDRDGRTVAATDRVRLGETHRNTTYFVGALRSARTVFTMEPREGGGYHFVYSRRVDSQGAPAGVIVVEVDLEKLERSWSRAADAVMVTDSQGEVILASVPRWRGRTELEALSVDPPDTVIARAFAAAQDFGVATADAFVREEAVLRSERRVNFQGWRMMAFTPYASVRERVNGILALEIMGFALLISLMFYLLNRRASVTMSRVQRESAELRVLNQRLQAEIAERRRMERNLEEAEQTLAQSSKLAALGEMSAAVSHELNQPLAAMKTYLAGVRLLLTRRRFDEADASVQRIDDLIGRMGAITKQLKSYARKGGEEMASVDAREAVAAALAMMEPQLRSRDVEISRHLPPEPVMVWCNRLRLEQVIVNLLRNALDATKGIGAPSVDVLLAAGERMRLSVRDNGHGINDMERLFEPFYTTKQPGDGVGLGLAISSGIITDFGGRLTARNGPEGGAIFEVDLPLYKDIKAAE